MKIGDVVVLKSGGVKMTINEIGQNGSINCMWYNQFTCRFEREQFNESSIRLYDLNLDSNHTS